MGKYFENTQLDSLWQRLVFATKNIASSSLGWSLEVKEGYEPDEYCYPYIIGNTLYSSGDPWEVLDENSNAIASFNPSEPWEIDLDPSKIYSVCSPFAAMADYTLAYKSSGDSVSSIHDILLSHFGLIHDNAPETPGDYMKGISVAANYYTNNN